jgi:hypothetical protein
VVLAAVVTLVRVVEITTEALVLSIPEVAEVVHHFSHQTILAVLVVQVS